jgi:hypothetical protein
VQGAGKLRDIPAIGGAEIIVILETAIRDDDLTVDQVKILKFLVLQAGYHPGTVFIPAGLMQSELVHGGGKLNAGCLRGSEVQGNGIGPNSHIMLGRAPKKTA